jgi:hypothetical protein
MCYYPDALVRTVSAAGSPVFLINEVPCFIRVVVVAWNSYQLTSQTIHCDAFSADSLFPRKRSLQWQQ